jgi:hypothetical protein
MNQDNQEMWSYDIYVDEFVLPMSMKLIVSFLQNKVSLVVSLRC